MLFNRSRALVYMQQAGLDALVATSPVNITYFSDYHCWIDPLFKEYMMVPGASSHLAQGYAVFPREGEPALVVSPLSAVNAADLWVRDLYTYGDPGLDTSLPPKPLSEEQERLYNIVHIPSLHATSTDALLHILEDRGLTEAQIGLEEEGLTPRARDAVLRGLPHAQVRDCSNLIRLLRAVKSADEIERLTRAAEISEQAAMESLALAQPGHPATDMVQHYRARVGALGADFDHFIFGMHGMGFATEPDYRLAADDVLEVDFGCIYRHCFSDSGTTLALRQAPDILLERHGTLRACIDAGREVMVPGAFASAVRAVMWETLNAHGITASFPHGHSLGLEVRDYPIIVADNGLRIRDECVDVPSDLPLEADMVINLEASIRMAAVGSLHIEQSFVVTDRGCHLLVSQDRSQPYVAAGSAT